MVAKASRARRRVSRGNAITPIEALRLGLLLAYADRRRAQVNQAELSRQAGRGPDP